MVCGKVVGALVEHFIVEYITLDHHFAADKVVDFNGTSSIDFEAHHILCALCYKAIDLIGRKGERVAHLHAGGRVVLEIGRGGACGVKFGRGVEGYVGHSGVKKHSDVLTVDVAALALLVGSVGSAFAHAFIDADAEPCEGLVDIVLGSGHKALGVGVFNSQDHFAPVLAGEEVVIQRGAYTANVQRPRG